MRTKLAATLDGHTALNNGHSQWITGQWHDRCSKVAGQKRGVDHRCRHGLADDPALSVRDASIAPHLQEAWVTRPRPVFVLDTSGRVPMSAKL